MPLTKTTIVPPGNADAILKLPILKMVVIVNNAAIAQTADDLAQSPPITDRQSIWFPGGLPAAYQGKFPLEDPANTVAFSLSTVNQVSDELMKGETIDDIRMEKAYDKA